MASSFVYSISAEVLQRRQRFATAFASLRHPRPQIPFWKLAAHRIPVLWVLYRNLLKTSSGENTRWRIRLFFEEHRRLTSPKQTKAKLEEAGKLLDILRAAKNGDSRAHRIADRYESMIDAKRKNEHMKTLLRKAWAWQHRLDHRPIVTGALLRPSQFNGPLPRLTPQPKHVSMMIYKRRLASRWRVKKYEQLKELRDDMQMEQNFEASLASLARDPTSIPSVFREPSWDFFLRMHIKYLKDKHRQEVKRVEMPFPPELLTQILAARREKPLNKMRERQRLLRGEVLPAIKARSIITRMRRRSHIKGPPAHVLSRMTPEKKRLDHISREPSEGGYSGLVKRALGMRLRDGDKLIEREDGMPKNQPWLDAMRARIYDANLEKKRSAGQESSL